MRESLHYITTRTCQKFYRRKYDLPKAIDSNLVESLKKFGKIEVLKFSNYHPSSMDLFKLTEPDMYEISGSIGGSEVFVTIKKNASIGIEAFEGVVTGWLSNE